MRRILFVSDYAPTESNSSGIVMAEQLLYLKKYAEIDILIYSSEMVEYNAIKTKSGRIYQRAKLGERQVNIKNNCIKRLFELLFNQTVLKVWLKLEKRFLKRVLRPEEYSEIFISVQGLYLAKLLVDFKFEKNSVIVQYWDPDIWWAERHNFTDHSTSEIFEVHRSMERKDYIREILVPSEGMADAIRARSEIEYSKVREFYPSLRYFSETVAPPKSFTDIRNKFSKIVVLAGAIYALEEIRFMIDVIEELNISSPNDKIQLIFIGPKRLSSDAQKLTQRDKNNSFIHFLGRLSVAEVDACLQLSDVNFLPYPFWHRELVKQSFPSKFSKYLGSGRNMLIAAPRHSSLTILLSKHGLHEGVVTTLSKTNLAKELSLLLSDFTYSEKQLKKLESIKREVFSSYSFETNLHSVFNLNDENPVEQDVIDVTIPVKQTWVHSFNKFIRDLSLFLENITIHPTHIFAIYLYQVFNLFGIIKFIKLIIGERNYERFLVGIKVRMKF